MYGDLVLALQVTVIGMGLVFAAILLLWGVIALLVRVTTSPIPSQANPEPAGHPLRQRAAAVAVAVALAMEERPKAEFSPLPAHPINPWQAALRGGQSEQVERRGRMR